MKIPKALTSIVGKTVKSVESYGAPPSITLKFTDGSSLGIMECSQAALELAFYRDEIAPAIENRIED